MSTGYIYDPIFLQHAAEGHVESPERLRAIMASLEHAGLLLKLKKIPFSWASEEDLLLVHSRQLIQQVKAGFGPKHLQLRATTPPSKLEFGFQAVKLDP